MRARRSTRRRRAPRGGASRRRARGRRRDALVGGVDQPAPRAPAPSSAYGKKPYATVPNASRSQWLSVKPARADRGTARAPGSSSRDERRRPRRQSGVSSGERVPPCASSELEVVVDVVAEHRAHDRLDVLRASGPAAAGSRPRSRTSAGMTFRLLRRRDHRRRERRARAAARRARRRVGRTARARSSDVAGGRHARRARVAGTPRPPGCSCRLGPVRGEPLDRARAALTSALSAMPGIDAWPERPCTRIVERRASSSRRSRRGRDAAAELEPVAAALVDRVVAAHGVGVRLAEPLEAEAVADLLVGGRGEDRGRRPARSPRARARRSRRRSPRPGPSCRARRGPRRRRRATSPENGRHRPLARVGEHDVGVARGAAATARRRVPRIRATRFARSGTRA